MNCSKPLYINLFWFNQIGQHPKSTHHNPHGKITLSYMMLFWSHARTSHETHSLRLAACDLRHVIEQSTRVQLNIEIGSLDVTSEPLPDVCLSINLIQ